jgi:ADP-ribose pyrophosphatase YjhB (NUDIX family)
MQVLLIKRATPPNVGWWSFPGGGLELGALADTKTISRQLRCGVNISLEHQPLAQ